MTSRVDAVAELKRDFRSFKLAMMPVPPHPEYAPQQGPPQGVPMEQGMPPQGGMPQDPAMGQPGVPADPSMMPPGGQLPPEAQQPSVQLPPELASMLEKVVQTMEEKSRVLEDKTKEQEVRIGQLEQQLSNDKAMREERKRLIDTMLPAV